MRGASFFLVVAALGPWAWAQGPDAPFSVHPFAGHALPSSAIVDGPVDEARFLDINGLWGDSEALYVADDRTLRRIDRTTRRVTSVTRQAGGFGRSNLPPNGYAGLRGLWGDGEFLYTLDVGEQSLVRVDRGTGEVFIVLETSLAYPWDLWGDEDRLWLANAGRGEIIEVNPATGDAHVAGTPGKDPINPFCSTPSSCLGVIHLSPRGVNGNAGYAYLAGYTDRVPRMNIETGAVEDFIDVDGFVHGVSACDSRLYLVLDGEIGVVDLDGPSYEFLAESHGARRLWCDLDSVFAASSSEVLRVDTLTGHVESYAGFPTSYSGPDRWADGVGTDARLIPGDLWGEGATLYFADRGGALRKVDLPTGEVVTVAGRPGESGDSDGPGPEARFGALGAIAGIWGNADAVFLADHDRIRRIDRTTFEVSTLADGFEHAYGLWGANSRLYVTDRTRGELVEIDLTNNTPRTITQGLVTPEDLWTDGEYAYVAVSRTAVERVSIASGESIPFAQFPLSSRINAVLGDGERLFITGPMANIELGSGDVELLYDWPQGDRFSGGWGIWENDSGLFWSDGAEILRLVPEDVSQPVAGSPISLSNVEQAPVVVRSRGNPTTVNTGFSRITPIGLASFAHATLILEPNGAFMSEAAIPSEPPRRTHRFPVVANPVENTGIAMVNPNPQPVEVEAVLQFGNGAEVEIGSFALGAGMQVASFLTEPPLAAPPDIAGTLTIRSTLPIALMALHTRVNARGDFLMSGIPTVGAEMPDAVSGMVIPLFAVGVDASSTLFLTNPGEDILRGTIQIPGFVGGSPFGPLSSLRRSDAEGSVVKADYTIAPGGTRIFELRGSAPESESGFLEVVPDDDVHPLAFARVQQHSGGMPVAETTVRAAVPDRAFGFESDGALDRGPGIAIANPSAVDVEVLVEPWSAYGTRNQPVYTLVVPGGGHVAVFLRDIRPPFPFSSAGRFFYRLTAPTDIVATGFRGRRNSHGETVVSAIPTVRASDPETTDVLFVPHFVNGGGYRTTWSFVPAGAGSAIDSTVEHFSPDGLAVGVP